MAAIEKVLSNGDLLDHILVRVPCKSLVRMKAVSKLWKATICSHPFRRKHLLRHPNPPVSVIVDLDGVINMSRYYYLCSTNEALAQFMINVENTYFSHCSNGLMLLRRMQVDTDHCWVYNPASGDSRYITFNADKRYNYTLGTSFPFDPATSPFYVIACVKTYESDSDSDSDESDDETASDQGQWYVIEIYSSETHTWEILEFNSDIRLPTLSHVVLTTWGVVMVPESYTLNILYLTRASNQISEIEYPDNPYVEEWEDPLIRMRFYNHVSNGELFQIHTVDDGTPDAAMQVWKLEGVDPNWVMMHNQPTPRFGEIFGVMNGSVVLVMVEGRITLYNFIDGTAEDDLVQLGFDPYAVVPFGEKLASV